VKSKSSKIKRESIILVVCLIAGLSLNVWSVLKYSNGLGELTGQLHIAFFTGIVIYFLILIFKLIFWAVLSFVDEK